MTLVGMENLPDEPVILVANHAQMNGPIACELYAPGEHYIWCAAQMMHLKEVPDYAFQDFWSDKPRYCRWFYRLLSYIIAPLSVCVFNNANTIGVYHDMRVMNTFKSTVQRLQEGANVVIFPEHNQSFNHIVYDFQRNFVDVAKLYYKRTGKEVCFVPMYIAPNLKQMHIGHPIRFCCDAPIAEERERICTHLMRQITNLAQSLPEHTVVPYRNGPKRQRPINLRKENTYEKAGN